MFKTINKIYEQHKLFCELSIDNRDKDFLLAKIIEISFNTNLSNMTKQKYIDYLLQIHCREIK